MDGMEEKLGNILNDPEMMRKIMGMAQALGATQAPDPADKAPQQPVSEPELGMLQKISGLARQGSIDKQQQNLLRALQPYLSRERIRKLENAMRAAKLARIAAHALGSQSQKLQPTR